MTVYYPEPTTAAEVMARARAVKLRHDAEIWASVPFDRAEKRKRLVDMGKEWAAREAACRQSEAWLKEQERKRLEAEAFRRLPMPARAREKIEEVARETGVTVTEILGERRYAKIVYARFLAVKRVSDETGWSLPRLGKLFNRDHTTILHALRRAQQLGTYP